MKRLTCEIRIDSGRVSVKHRASLWNYKYIGIIAVYLLSIFDGFDHLAWQRIVFLAVPVVIALFAVIPGEVMQCDAHELHLASRQLWGRWKRLHFPSSKITSLKWDVRRVSKYNVYTVITLQYDGQTVDILKNLTWTDGDRILRACRSMGIDTIIDETDAVMRRDIDKRGWWINPLRPDRDENSSISK